MRPSDLHKLEQATKSAVLSRKPNLRIAKVFFVCATAIETLPPAARWRMAKALQEWVRP